MDKMTEDLKAAHAALLKAHEELEQRANKLNEDNLKRADGYRELKTRVAKVEEES